MATYTLKFMFDWGSGICVWSTNDAARNRFNYPVYTYNLPISEELKDELEHLISWHDEALNWDEPNSDLLWNDKQKNDFLNVAQKLYYRLCEELGSDYEVEFIRGM